MTSRGDTNTNGIQPVLITANNEDKHLHANERPSSRDATGNYHSLMHTGPYCGPFRGCIWNCWSLWSRNNRHTFQQALHLLDIHDFLILAETRETTTRNKYTEDALPKQCRMYSTGISAKKGGVAIIVKQAFLDVFDHVVWAIIVDGRVGRLTLEGPKGKLCLYAVYLDPSSIENQSSAIHDISKAKGSSCSQYYCWRLQLCGTLHLSHGEDICRYSEIN